MSREDEIQEAKDRRTEQVRANGCHICMKCGKEIEPQDGFFAKPLMEHVLKCTGKKSYEC